MSNEPVHTANPELVDKILSYTKENGYNLQGLRALAEHVVAVKNGEWYWDIFFDARKYRLAHPEVWNNGNAKKPPLFPYSGTKRDWLGILPGTCRLHHPQQEDTLPFAKNCLEPFDVANNWYG